MFRLTRVPHAGKRLGNGALLITLDKVLYAVLKSVISKNSKGEAPMAKIRRGQPKIERKRQFNIRISENEMAAINKMAEAYGYHSVSAFIRELIFNSDVAQEVKIDWEEANE